MEAPGLTAWLRVRESRYEVARGRSAVAATLLVGMLFLLPVAVSSDRRTA